MLRNNSKRYLLMKTQSIQINNQPAFGRTETDTKKKFKIKSYQVADKKTEKEEKSSKKEDVVNLSKGDVSAVVDLLNLKETEEGKKTSPGKFLVIALLVGGSAALGTKLTTNRVLKFAEGKLPATFESMGGKIAQAGSFLKAKLVTKAGDGKFLGDVKKLGTNGIEAIKRYAYGSQAIEKGGMSASQAGSRLIGKAATNGISILLGSAAIKGAAKDKNGDGIADIAQSKSDQKKLAVDLAMQGLDLIGDAA